MPMERVILANGMVEAQRAKIPILFWVEVKVMRGRRKDPVTPHLLPTRIAIKTSILCF